MSSLWLCRSAGLLSVVGALSAWAAPSMVDVDYARLVSVGDLRFSRQVEPNLGLPVGNGRTAALVSTQEDRVRFTVNRYDVVSGNSADHGDFKQYCNAVSHVRVILGAGAFPTNAVAQHLSLYDGTLTIVGSGVEARVFACEEADAMVVEVTDRRDAPQAVTVELQVAPPAGRNVQGRAVWQCSAAAAAEGSRAVNSMTFETTCDTGIAANDHYCRAAAVASVLGRAAVPRTEGRGLVRLAVPAGKGRFAVVIGSAGSLTRTDDVVAAAQGVVNAVEARTVEALHAATVAWWHAFWSRSFVWLPASGALPGYGENPVQHWLTVFYNMGCSMRGAYPAKFNGLYATGDGRRDWGLRYWWFNQGRMGHYAADKANHGDLNDSLFNWFTRSLPKMEIAARQQWGSQGLYFPEVMGWDGPEVLPEDVAVELRDYLLNQKITPRLVAFKRARNMWESRWSWEQDTWKAGFHTHLLYNGADMANLYWNRYQYTLDEAWLRDRAYPVIRDVAEFYRNHPMLRKGSDGAYHLGMTGWAETYMGMADCFQDMAFMRGIFPVAIRASERLGVDGDLRPRWKEVLENLGPYPTQLAGIKDGYGVGNRPALTGSGGGSCWDERLGNLLDFDVLTLESRDAKAEEWRRTSKTLEGLEAFQRIMRGESPGNDGDQPWSRLLSNSARMGRADVTRQALDAYLAWWRKSADTRWPNHLDQRNGNANMGLTCDAPFVEGLQDALLDCPAPGPGEDPVIHVFPAWPPEVDAVFQLRAKGGFLVCSSMRGARVEFVELVSEYGGVCRLRSPWGAGGVDLHRDGKPVQALRPGGSAMALATDKGERLVLAPAGSDLSTLKRTVAPAAAGGGGMP